MPGASETLRYLREQHASIMKRIEHYTTPGHGAPGFVAQLQVDARAIEATMLALLSTPRGAEADSEVTPEMFDAYRGALKAYIDSVPEEERARRWKQNGNGWVIPETEKCVARWRAMVRALRSATGDSEHG